ncbi:cysteine ABC transporter substrate-binding protein [Methylobacterium sp. Leaf361]|nr:cysteine ABC transporter substrate-binding protein [Methylobacterium sp. Leaf361]
MKLISRLTPSGLGSILAALTVLVTSLVAVAGAAQADQLADIKARGKLICGTLGTVEPFSFQHPQSRQIVGYDVDICQKVADAIGVPLELKTIAVEARIPELTQGRVDILAANLGYTAERGKQIQFSDTYFVSQQKLMTTKESGLTAIDQLAGKKITALKGSSSEQGVRRLIPTAETVTFQDTSSAFLALAQDKVDALCASELILVKLQHQSKVPMFIIPKALFVEPWGLGMRKDELAFTAAVNATLTKLAESGQLDAIYAKWLGEDTPYKIKRDFTVTPIKD